MMKMMMSVEVPKKRKIALKFNLKTITLTIKDTNTNKLKPKITTSKKDTIRTSIIISLEAPSNKIETLKGPLKRIRSLPNKINLRKKCLTL